MHIVFRILSFTAFLIFFTTLAIYFAYPLPEESIATKSQPEKKESSLDLNQVAARVKRHDLPKLLTSILDDQNGAKSSGYIYVGV